MVGIPAGCRRPFVPAGYARRQGEADGRVLDRDGDAVLHFLHDPGVLLHADLPGHGIASRFGHGIGVFSTSHWHAGIAGHFWGFVPDARDRVAAGVAIARSRRYLTGVG